MTGAASPLTIRGYSIASIKTIPSMNTRLMAVVLAAVAYTFGGTAQADGSADSGKKKTQMCAG